MFRILERAAQIEAAWEKMMMEMSGYERKTTFYAGLTIADAFGEKAIKDTYRRVCKSWMDSIEYITEFAICLNHKSWEHKKREDYCKLYSDLWYEIKDKICEHYKDDEEAISYFYCVTD